MCVCVLAGGRAYAYESERGPFLNMQMIISRRRYQMHLFDMVRCCCCAEEPPERERERERERSVRVCICSPAFVCVILSRWAFELFRRRGIPQLRLSGSSIVAHAMTISREKESFCPAHTHTVDLVVGRGYRMSLSSLLQVQKYPSAARALAPIPNLCSTVTLN
jgi:hypothetical protein